MHFSCQEREKKEKIQTNDHRRQSNHDMSTCAASYEREHDYASSYATDEQIWSLESVSRAFLMALKYPERQSLFFFCVF